LFILKSRSPRRIQLLKDLDIHFQIEPSDINETQDQSEPPMDYLRRMVTSKLGDFRYLNPLNTYLSCDTIVLFENQILHKPSSEAEAMDILERLNGRTHSVFSASAMTDSIYFDYFYEETQIRFHDWDTNARLRYIREEKPYDKAGSYGVQDRNGPVAERYGSYCNVLGFPLRSFLERWQSWIHYWPAWEKVKI
jgi:septum formation protein